MRTTVLATALLMYSAIAGAMEPSAPEAKPAAVAEETAAKPAEQSAADNAATASVATVVVRPFKPPSGWRPKRMNGETVYCIRTVVLGSRFMKEDCRTEPELRDLEVQKASMRNELDQRNHICSGGTACGT